MSRREIHKGTRERVYREHPHNCAYCGVRLCRQQWAGTTIREWIDAPGAPAGWYHGAAPGHEWAEIDHVVPIAKGGSNRYENLVLSCGPCNRRKGAS